MSNGMAGCVTAPCLIPHMGRIDTGTSTTQLALFGQGRQQPHAPLLNDDPQLREWDSYDPRLHLCPEDVRRAS